MSFGRSFFLVLLWACVACAMDPPVPFVNKGAPYLAGLPGWNSNPARRGQPAFGFSYWTVPELQDEWAVGAAGEWGGQDYRIAFFFYYSEMDSLFREHYGELDAAYSCGPVIFGASYGTLLGWVPRESRWGRHRLKFGTGLQWGGFYGGLWTIGFTDETWGGRGSLSWAPSKVFSLSVESDGNSLGLVHEFFFDFGTLSSFYTFPHFSVGVELVLNLNFLECGGTHGFGNGNLGWNGLWVRKKLYLQKHDSDSKNRKY